jgi:hypothetical protein
MQCGGSNQELQEPLMSMTVHALRFEHEAIDPHHTAQQFKISSAWALLVGSLILGIIGVLWFMMDLGLLLVLMLDAWFGDYTLLQRYGITLFLSAFFALHICGGIMFLGGAIESWCSPYRLIVDGNGQLIILSKSMMKPYHQVSVSSTQMAK